MLTILVFVILGLLAVWVAFLIMRHSREKRRQTIRRPGLPPGSAPSPSRMAIPPIVWVIGGIAVLLAAGLLQQQGATPKTAPRVAPTAPATPAPQAPTTAGTTPPPPPANGPLPEASAIPVNPVHDPIAEEKRWLAQARRMMATGHYSIAAQSYWEALRVNPSSPQARDGFVLARRRAAEAEAQEAKRREAEAAATAPPFSSYPSGAITTGASPAAPAPANPAPSHGHSNGTTWTSTQDSEYHRQRGDQFMARGLPNLALEEYELALQSAPSDQGLRAKLAEARQAVAAKRQAGIAEGKTTTP